MIGRGVLMRGGQVIGGVVGYFCGGGVSGRTCPEGMVRIMRVLKTMGGSSLKDKYVRGVENVLADGITRGKESCIHPG